MNKLLFAGLLSFCLFACGDAEKPAGTEDTAAADSTATNAVEMAPAEFADAKYLDMAKKINAQFSSKDVDALMTSYADDAQYNWSGGDSLVGKAAISAYWKDRFANVVESLKFSNEIWLPIKINKPQATEAPGVWLLGWYQVTAKYKTGKEITFWAHSDHHLNANDKIDQTILYIDRVPINAAMAAK